MRSHTIRIGLRTGIRFRCSTWRDVGSQSRSAALLAWTWAPGTPPAPQQTPELAAGENISERENIWGTENISYQLRPERPGWPSSYWSQVVSRLLLLYLNIKLEQTQSVRSPGELVGRLEPGEISIVTRSILLTRYRSCYFRGRVISFIYVLPCQFVQLYMIYKSSTPNR